MSIKYICVILQKYAKVPLTVLLKKKKLFPEHSLWVLMTFIRSCRSRLICMGKWKTLLWIKKSDKLFWAALSMSQLIRLSFWYNDFKINYRYQPEINISVNKMMH